AALADPKAAANWTRGELRAQLRERGLGPWESQATPPRLAAIVRMVEARRVSVPAAKEVLAEVIATGVDPERVVEERGLGQIGDEDELAALVDRLLAEHPDQARQLREGKEKVIGYFVGQAMKATGGRVDPAAVGRLARERGMEEAG